MQGRLSGLARVGGTRPQAMLWSDNPGTLDNGFYVPQGIEGQNFIIVSDHNRSEISFNQERIENRQRMVNGGMRSYWIADKLRASCTWQRLPSRPFDQNIIFDENGNIDDSVPSYISYTVDNAAGGMDMLSWYESTPGSFYLFLSYDKYRVNGLENYDRLKTYAQVIKVYFSQFEYSVEKRSTGNFDFWNISVTMEEA